MPTANPRLTITLQPALAAVLRRVSQLTGNSQSAMIAELLSDSLPIFERMVEVLEAAERLRSEAMEAPEEVTRSLNRAQARIESQLGLVLDDMGEGYRPLLEAAERVQRRRKKAPPAAAAASGGAVTPPSNMGVRSPHPPSEKDRKDRKAAERGSSRQGRGGQSPQPSRPVKRALKRGRSQ